MARKKSGKTGQEVLANGAVYDYDVGRIVANPGGGSHAITSANSHDMQKLAVQRKREVMLKASGRMVQDKKLIEEYGVFAPVAERAQVLQQIATTPDAGKAAVMAHQALTRDTGMEEPKAHEADAQPARVTNVLILDGDSRALLADLLAIAGKGSVVDGKIQDKDTNDTESST